MELTLPWPPSVNHYWRKWRNRMVISDEGRDYRRLVGWMLGGGGIRKPPAGGRIALAMDAFPPDRRRRDLDNLPKCSQDSLAHAGVYEDDSQIDLLTVRRRRGVVGGSIVVTIQAFPLNCCPLCGGPWQDEDRRIHGN